MASRAAGWAVILVVTSVATGVVYRAAPDAAVLGTWTVGAGALWWSMYRTSNPAPPPCPERGSKDEEAGHSFAVVEDRPGHHRVVWDDTKDDES